MNQHAMKYVYILSSPHGGSTLMSLILGRHPEIANLGEVSFIPKLLAMGELCTCGDRLSECAEWAKVFESVQARENVDMRRSPYDFFLGDAIKDKHGTGLVDHEYQTTQRKICAKLRGGVETAGLLAAPTRRILGALTPPAIKTGLANTSRLYDVTATAWGKRVTVDASKFPRKATQLYVNHPDRMRILHLVRDGRSVVTSRIKYMTVARAAERWRRYHWLTTSMTLRWVPAADRRQLRFEDFVASPESQLRALCEWLEIDYSSRMIDFSGTQIDHSAGGNPARFRFDEGIKPAHERWRTLLSKDQLAEFESIGGALNRQFGYE